MIEHVLHVEVVDLQVHLVLGQVLLLEHIHVEHLVPGLVGVLVQAHDLQLKLSRAGYATRSTAAVTARNKRRRLADSPDSVLIMHLPESTSDLWARRRIRNRDGPSCCTCSVSMMVDRGRSIRRAGTKIDRCVLKGKNDGAASLDVCDSD